MARGKARPKAEPLVAAVVSPEVFVSQMREVRRLLKDMQDAQAIVRTKNSVYRTGLKTAHNLGEALGHTSGDITDMIKLMDTPVEEIDRHTRALNRLAVLMEFPIGTQLGMFEDPESGETTSVATAAEDDGFDALEAVEREGWTAQRAGWKREENPYPPGSEAEKHEAWERGWNRSLQAIGMSLGEDAPKAPVEMPRRRRRSRKAEPEAVS